MKKIVILAFIFFMSGCSLLPPVKADDTTNYIFNRLPYVKKYHRHPITLYVSPIESDPNYNTENMAYSTHPYVIEYFAKNKWADTPARLLKPLVLKTLQDTRYFHAVTTSPNAIHYDYILNVKLVELNQIFYSHGSCERLILYAEIVNAKTRRIVASREISIIKPAIFCSPYGGVAAANRAVAEALAQLAQFCVKVI